MNNENKISWKLENSYLLLPDALYTRINPSKVDAPKLAMFNYVLADEIGLNFKNTTSAELAEIFSGNQLPEGAQPIALAYAGHQFGYFTVLGDGRAILLGEQITPSNNRYDIQLKGCGQTPYSRNGDGKATLSSMLREYLISEAIHHLGIPTSRSLAVVRSNEKIRREQFMESAILTRIAGSHLRIGTFEFVSRYHDKSTLKKLSDYAIQRHYPELLQTDNPPLALFKTVMHQQIALVVNWMRVGFIHGVMNTDNTSVSGETIDYGPCAFMNAYDPITVFSSIDHYGRYSFGNQPAIIQWNLSCLAGALIPIIHDDEKKAIELLNEILHDFPYLYKTAWLKMMCSKLGLFTSQNDDIVLVEDLLNWMKFNKADFTNTFLHLQSLPVPDEEIYQNDAYKTWLQRWQLRIASERQDAEMHKQLMSAHNPVYIPRNHMVETALKAASENDNYELFMRLVEVISKPYAYKAEYSAYQQPPDPEADLHYQTFCGT
ncbi:MAG: YdiU family protein [Bacteroidetes bacterium]|nr:YdiU family protein [Bacteroidota bacterium]